MRPKILFCDMEGTVLAKEHRLDDGRVAPSSWTLLAEALGKDCLAEEQASKDRWNSGGYDNYLHWMRHTVDIHRKHKLTKSVFDSVIDSVKFMPGVDAAFGELRREGVVTALITGGFKALADRVQRKLHVDYAFSGCDYFFDPDTGLVDHVNLLPADEVGKVNFMKLLCNELKVGPNDCAFVGDGMNDVHLAEEVGYSIAFNAQEQLRRVATAPIQQAKGAEDFMEVVRVLRKDFSGNNKLAVTDNQKRRLVVAAERARKIAYAPYSKFLVGAAVVTDDGEIFDGCNIENASYGATVCAERVAIFKAVNAGKTNIRGLAVVGEYPMPLPPCGICRQVLAEFADKDAVVIMKNTAGLVAQNSASELLPLSFEFHGVANE